jgi:hypothetical protein
MLINGRVKVIAEFNASDEERDFVQFFSYFYDGDLRDIEINTYYNMYSGEIRCEKVLSFLPSPDDISEEEREFINVVRNVFKEAIELYRELKRCKIFVEEDL